MAASSPVVGRRTADEPDAVLPKQLYAHGLSFFGSAKSAAHVQRMRANDEQAIVVRA